jgi:hypothetical protein
MRPLRCIPLFASVVLLASCVMKDASFFAPEYTTTDKLPDVTPPTFLNFKPSAQMMAVYNVDQFNFDFVDVAAANGVPASGVDLASVRTTYGSNQSLTFTRAGDTYTASLTGVSDGAQTFRMEGRDLAGNAATGSMTLTLDRSAPNINVTQRPAVSTNSNAPSADIEWRLGITDPHLMNAVGSIYRAGADNLCGTMDDVLVPKGTGPDQVSENTWNYSLANANNLMVRYTAYNPVQAGGTTTSRRSCFTVNATDGAVGINGTANPNIGRLSVAYDFVWAPVPPPTGTIRGTVFRDGLPASGVTVTLGALVGGANVTTLTNAAGSYEFTNVDVGIRNLGVTAPTGTVCNPSVGIATVTANTVSTVDFGCNTPTGTIAGRVMIGTTPLAGVTLTVNGNTRVSDADGRYEFTGLAPGLYTVLLTNIPSTATCTVAALLVTVTSGAQAAGNFTCTPTPATLSGTVLIEGQPASGYRIVLSNGDFRVTGADGRYAFNGITPAVYTMIISQLPSNVTCAPMSAVVTIAAAATVVQNFACGAVSVATSYYHLTSTSVVCVAIAVHPSLGNLSYVVRVTGPGVIGSGTVTGTMTGGLQFTETDINTYGTYLANVTVNGLVMSPRQQIVTAAPGTCIPLSPLMRR